MRIMAIDYGDARTGVAISDMSGTLTGRAFTIHDTYFDRLVQRLCDEAAENGVSTIVLGYPKNMDGTLGPRAAKSEELSKLLRARTGLEVVLWDERRTTVDAHRILSETGRRGKKVRDSIDAVAASLILESYLNKIK